ncbi:hypothetical protein [Rubinisphaera sp.]|uniref:hypothetical protein n=1 Tax=Rubinisphaera sp. TaxID=2024857 RepID=UPI000C102001|nr:hypothetical protein [Rubinisphaera sp.]MBV10191.1 hypothetical protein [Rubinisphaera sp.]HCS50230.1 hypothetical protein [Planctomycetaceae bacterium]|tara:strand:- start:9550 stop:9999 length:450 start_codon:yes stop_codon:yes gene_type:complete
MSPAEVHFNHLSLQQLSELEYILLGDLRDVLDEESNEQNRKWLSAIVEALLRTIPREFDLRCNGGYMQEVLLVRPEADAEVQNLRNEQRSLCDQLQEISDRLSTSRSFQKHALALKQELADWSEHLRSHNINEERLVQDVYLLDIGGGD